MNINAMVISTQQKNPPQTTTHLPSISVFWLSLERCDYYHSRMSFKTLQGTNLCISTLSGVIHLTINALGDFWSLKLKLNISEMEGWFLYASGLFLYIVNDLAYTQSSPSVLCLLSVPVHQCRKWQVTSNKKKTKHQNGWFKIASDHYISKRNT